MTDLPRESAVDCRLCGRPAENPSQWPICRACFESGAYRTWLEEELGRADLAPPRRRELEQALARL